MIFKEQLTNISSVLNNTGNTTQLLTSFGSLDIAQQKVLLSSKLLTEEQKAQCATMMALSSVNTKYTSEQLIRSTGISSETLATWGLTQATDTLTVSQLAELASSDAQAKTVLEKIVAQNAQAVANGKVTATNIALATSEEGATLSTGAFTTAIKANIAAIKTWLLTTPAGWLTILVGGIFTAVKLYDLFTISVEEANEKIDESRSAYEETTSTIESMNSELEMTKKRIEELEAKDTLSFTDKAELDNLREQNAELERSISLLEKKRQNEAKQTVVDIKQNQETLDEDFDKSIKNLSEYKKEYEETRQLGIKGMAQGAVALENYETTMAAMDKTMGQYESSVLDNIEKYEQYKEDIINKYGTNDISTFSQSDRTLYNDIVSRLQAAYKEIYTDSEYNKFVIEPIFDEEKLKGLQDELLKYFINSGQTDLSSLEEKFGSDIITALRNACAKAGIDFDKMIQDMYDNSQSKLNQIAPLVDKPNGVYDAKQNQISKQIRDYIQNDLSDEDRTILLNATIPDDAKFKTKQDVDNFIASLREDINTSDETISLDSVKESVTGLAEEYTLLQEILKDTANVSEETYTKLLACSSKYSAALKTESGRLVVNKNKLLAVSKARAKDQKQTIKQAVAQKKLEYLKQAKYLKVYDNQLIDTTSDTYDNINAIQEEITQYQLLAEQLDSATSAFERFKEAQQTDNTPQNDTANDAFKTIKEGLESGQVGTDDFRTAQELLMGAKEYQEFLELGNSAENPLEKQYLYMEKWQNKTKQFFGEDMKQNVINFLDALDATGLLQDGMLASSSKIGEALGLSLDSVNALVEGVNTYGFKDIIQQSQIDFVDEYTERVQNLNDTKEAYYEAEKSRDGKENNNYIEGLKQDWKDEQTAYDQFMQSLPNRYADIVSAFENSGTDKSFSDYFTDAMGGNENALAFTEAVGDGISYINDKISDLNHQGIFSSEEIDNLNTVKDSLTEMRQQLSKSTNTFLKDSDAQKYVDLLAKKKKLEGTEKTSSNAKQIASELSDVQSQLDSLEKPTVIELQLNKSAVDAQIAEVEAQIKRLDSLTAKIDVSSGQAGAYQAVNAITSAKNQANSQLQGLQKQSEEYEVAIKYVTDTSEMDEAIDSIPENTESKVTFNVNGVSELQKANDIIKGLSDKTITVNVNTNGTAGLANLGNKMGGGMPSNLPVVNGTAHANGTNWALKSNEKGALVGELGTEGLVRDGKFYLIGEHGTQFMDLEKDDIIFNHKQVEQLQKNGHITGRGKMVGGAFVDGTLVGTAHADVNNRYNTPYIKNGADAINQNQALKKASKEIEETIDETTEDIEEASEEIFDWIERKVKKLQRLYDRWISNAEKTFSTTFINKFFSHANSNLNKQLKTQSAAFDRYMQEANNSGLSDDYKQKVADGLIDIEKIADENLSKQINDYQTYFDKSIDSLTAFEEASEKKFNLPLEKATQKIELFKNQIDLLGKKIDNTVGYKAKNKLVDDQTTQEKKTLAAYKQASKATQKNLNSQKKNMTLSSILNGADVSKKEKKQIKANVKNGKELDLLWFKEGSKAYQAAVKYNDALRANEQATLDLANAQEDYNSWLQEAAKMKFDNIADFYSNQINLLDMSQKKIEDRISLLEAKGMSVNAKYYQGEIDYIKASRQQNEQKYTELSASLAKMEKDGLRGTDAWWEEVEALSAVNDAITQCDINIANMNNKITETSETLINKVLDSVKSVSEEMEFMTGLMSKMDMFSEDSGAFTDEGLATMGGYASGANNSKYAQNYVDGFVKAFEQAKKDGKLEFTYDGQLFTYNSDEQRDNAELEWIKTLKDATQDYYDYTNKQIDMMIEKYQAELSALKEIIDAKKSSLDAEKDLYNYQKSIQSAVSDAASLEKQIAALQGNNSEENMMKIQKLQKELGDSRQDIADQEYERLVSDQQNMLDKLYSEYEALINKKTKDRNKLLVEANTIARATQDTIQKTFTEYGEKYNYTDYLGKVNNGLTTLSGNLSPLENIKNDVFDAVQPEGAIGKIPTAIGNVNTTLGGIATTVKSILEAYIKPPTTDNNSSSGNGSSTTNTSDKDKALVLDGVTSTLTGLIQKVDSATEKSTNATANATGSIANVINKVAQITSGISQNKNTKTKNKNTKTKALDYINGSAGKPSKKKSEYSAVNQKIWDLTNGKVLSSSELKKLAEIIGVKYNNATKTGNLYKGLKSLGIKGFKRGGVVSVDSLEKQIKANGDTTLLSGNPGERMLTAKQNDLFEKFVGELPQLNQLGNVIKPLVDMPKIPNVQPANRNMNNIVNVDNITLPNVKNYDEFKTQMFRDMQTDRKFENMIENMSIDKLDKNYNSLKKLKHRF